MCGELGEAPPQVRDDVLLVHYQSSPPTINTRNKMMSIWRRTATALKAGQQQNDLKMVMANPLLWLILSLLFSVYYLHGALPPVLRWLQSQTPGVYISLIIISTRSSGTQYNTAACMDLAPHAPGLRGAQSIRLRGTVTQFTSYACWQVSRLCYLG